MADSRIRRTCTIRSGFTLVEVLVVILIITILIALLVPALGYAVRRAENFGYVRDLAALEQAIEQYRSKYNDYPPDFSDAYDGSPKAWEQTVVYRHLRDSFQRIHPTEIAAIRALTFDLPPEDPSRLSTAQALVFWLGGLSENPRYPFSGEGGPLSGGERKNSLMEFKEQQLDFSGGFPVFLPRGRTSPFVYFDSRTYAYGSYPGHASLASAGGIAFPYFGQGAQFVNPETYQLICAGSDDIYAFSTAQQLYTRFPSGFPVRLNSDGSVDGSFTPDPGINYLEGQQDNLANFSEGSLLGDSQLQ
jgi:prepilin-type N-terminal cleavage/methylation domain-containing protein